MATQPPDPPSLVRRIEPVPEWLWLDWTHRPMLSEDEWKRLKPWRRILYNLHGPLPRGFRRDHEP